MEGKRNRRKIYRAKEETMRKEGIRVEGKKKVRRDKKKGQKRNKEIFKKVKI